MSTEASENSATSLEHLLLQLNTEIRQILQDPQAEIESALIDGAQYLRLSDLRSSIPHDFLSDLTRQIRIEDLRSQLTREGLQPFVQQVYIDRLVADIERTAQSRDDSDAQEPQVFVPIHINTERRPLVITTLNAEQTRRQWNQRERAPTLGHLGLPNQSASYSTPPALADQATLNADTLADVGEPRWLQDQDPDDCYQNDFGNDDAHSNDDWDDYEQYEIGECPACTDQVNEDEAVYVTCGHAWHRECLNDNFRNALTSRTNWPAKCCDAGARINHETVQEYLDEDVLILLFERVEEYDSPNPVFCSNFNCSSFIPDAIVEASQVYFVECPLCRSSTCKDCKSSTLQHPMPRLCPNYLSQENKELAEQEGWKQCPRAGCHSWIDRSEGCDTIECPVCKTEFCYRCGSLIRNGIPCNCAGQNEWVEELGQWMRGDPEGHIVGDGDQQNVADEEQEEEGDNNEQHEIEGAEGSDVSAVQNGDDWVEGPPALSVPPGGW